MATHSIDVDSANFQQVVLEGSKQAPVVIDFWAPWCAPCRALKPVLEKLAAEYAGKFTLAKINSDENPDLAAQFGVRGIPAVKAVVDGELVDEFTGALPESQVRAFVERILPTPSSIARKEARALLDSGQAAAALTMLDDALALDPRNEAAKVDKLEALIALERTAAARALLDDLNLLTLNDPRVAILKAKLAFSDSSDEDSDALAERIRKNAKDLDARLALARQHVRAGNYEPALEQLLEIIRQDRKFGDDVGRRTMLEVFNLLGGGNALVGDYRRKLASALY
jgi:putative thioredoxin